MTTRPEDRIPDDAATQLWRAWAEHGDVKSRDRLVLSYAPMVKYLATRKVRELPSHIALDDLVSAGLIGLDAGRRPLRPRQGRDVRAVRLDARVRGDHRRDPPRRLRSSKPAPSRA